MDEHSEENDFSSVYSTPDSYESELEAVFDEIRIEKQLSMVREKLEAYYTNVPVANTAPLASTEDVDVEDVEDDDDTDSDSYIYEEGDDVLWELLFSDPKMRHKDF
ncbi:unnamed protein product [Cuscuta campestris]|uniref:Uncharacterized protein n=1 Tax=Cuscuta campestris TaxID=132261 RepID=A0A484LA89_9ASTE|nr:unnamed protein product [Cuscuta campestris]